MGVLVSIGMPVFNCESTLAMAMASILDQRLEDWELLVLDDGSTDNTLAVARRFDDPRIRILSDGANIGLPRRLNQAVHLARGAYFARMDGDDVAYPERLAMQAGHLGNHPDTDLVAARVLIFDADGRVVGTYPFRRHHEAICRRPQGGFYFPHPTWMGRRSWFQAHPYRSSDVRAEDQCLLLSSYRHSRFSCIPDILLGYRQPHLVLKNILRGRASYGRALLREGLCRKRPALAAGVFEQCLKAVVDTVAIASGLNYRILRHRALPVTGQEALQWRDVWDGLNREGTAFPG